MKTTKPFNDLPPTRIACLVSTCLLLAVLGTTSAFADTVYVTGCISNCVSTTVCGSAPNPDINNTLQMLIYNENYLGAYTSAKASGSAVADKPTTPGSRYFSNSFSNTVPDMLSCIVVAPELALTGAIYRIDHTYSSSAGNCSSNIIVGITNFSGCTISTTNTDKFQSRYGNSTWQTIGYLTNNPDSSTPVLGFYYVSGTVSAGLQNRMEIDTFRFIYFQPCLTVAAPTVTGPLGTNATGVTVTGIANNATTATAYQDSGSGMVSIGSLAITSTPAPATVVVPVTGLAYGARVAATQTVGGQESCVPTAGTLVGVGPNSNLRIALSIRGNPNLAGPVGTPGGGTNSNVYFLGAPNTLAGACPGDALIVYPSNTWQTITFQRGGDSLNPISPTVLWNNGTGTATPDIQGNFGALDGIALASQGDPGNYDIYIDNLANGTNGVFEDYEVATGGATWGFSQPNYSGTTSPFLLGAPNQSVIATNTAFAGRKCTRVQWQFVDGATNKWLRLVHSGNTGVANPQVDLNEPISFQLLLLRPGDPVPQPPLPGSLAIQHIGDKIVLNWYGSYPLQSSSSLTGGWSDVGVSTGPHTNNVGAGPVFYRLRSN